MNKQRVEWTIFSSDTISDIPNYLKWRIHVISSEKWDNAFKNGPIKICERQPLKNFTWSILEYLVSNFLRSVRPCFHYISDWTAYRAVRNKLKHAVRTTKKKFLTSALSDKRPRSIWRFIHRISKPRNQTITVNVDDLNKHLLLLLIVF